MIIPITCPSCKKDITGDKAEYYCNDIEIVGVGVQSVVVGERLEYPNGCPHCDDYVGEYTYDLYKIPLEMLEFREL